MNHLLDAAPWASGRLAPFAGETVEIEARPWPLLRLTIAEGGRVKSAGHDAQASLQVLVKPEAPAALLRGKEHFLHAIEVTGNARLADEVMVLARNLRWDYEEDLSRFVGDVAAHRLAGAARDFVAWQADAAQRLASSFAEYATEEKKLILRRDELDSFAQAIARLRDGVERLEQRVRRLG